MQLVKISNTYEGKELNLIKEKETESISWQAYPVIISKTQLSTLTMDRVLAVLADTWKSPSELAGLSRDQIIAPIIPHLDRDFRDAREQYITILLEAGQKDFKHIKNLEQQQTLDLKSWVGWGADMGAKCLIKMGFPIKSPKEAIALEGSAHRFRWLNDIDTREELRHNRIKTQVKLCMRPLIIDLDKFAQSKLINIERLVKAEQLLAVFEAVFPNEQLMTEDSQAVKPILLEYRRKLNALAEYAQ